MSVSEWGAQTKTRERSRLTCGACRSCATFSASRIPESASRSASRSMCASRISRPASPAAAAIAANRLASAFFARAFFLRARSLSSLRTVAASDNVFAAGSGERSGGGAHTGVCGLAHSVAPSCADEVPIEPSASARARISQLGSISD